MIFVDASAIVAVLLREPEMESFARILEREASLLTSPIAVFEAALAVRRRFESTVEEALADVNALVEQAGITVVAIEASDGEAALLAHALYGKGRGHPAQLNMGDCFAYAMARARGASLLYKGDDFRHTDIPPALALPG